MEFYEVVAKRRTVRGFSEEKVSEEKILKILETGIKAPSYNHRREWDFILISDELLRLKIIKSEGIPDSFNISEIEQSILNYDSITKQMYLDAIPKQKSMLLNAPEVLAVIYKPKTNIKESERVYDLNCLASVWCCIENILLAMAAEDIFGVTYIPQNTLGLKKLLGIPEELEIAALLPFGFKEENLESIQQNKINVKKKIHYNKW